MQLMRYDSPDEFLAKAQPYLEQEEVVNGLLLGIALRLQAGENRTGERPYLTIVSDEEGIVGTAVMTPPRNLLLYSDREKVGTFVEAIAQNLLAEGWTLPGVLAPAAVSLAFAEAWQRETGRPYHAGMRERVYELRQVNQISWPSGSLQLAEETHIPLVTKWLTGFYKDVGLTHELTYPEERATELIGNKKLYFWQDNQPVSMAISSRPTTNGITVTLVYTPPEFRRSGYATACVAALSQLLLDEGYQYCTLFTDLANPTSNHIYQEIGYKPRADFDEYRFVD